MKTASSLLILIITLIGYGSARAQLTVPSYNRSQPFIFCGGIPQGDYLSVPFDLVNTGTAPITIDSAIATGDTADFYANYLVGSNDRYLNPVNWKYINGKTIDAKAASFTSFTFAPRTPGNKLLTLTVYYHDNAGAAQTTQATLQFHTTDAPAGLGFLHTVIDTVHYGPGTGFTAVTYDRSLAADTLIIRDTVTIGDTLFAAKEGIDRLDLTTCGGVTITSITANQSDPSDIFALLAPTAPVALGSGDSILIDFYYVPVSHETVTRDVYITYVTAEGYHAVLRLVVITREPLGVEDGPSAPDERGGVITIARQGLESMPNPFTGAATLRLSAARPEHARLTVLNALGEEVAVLLDRNVEAGMREVRFDAVGLPAGIYFARLELGGDVLSKRLILMR